MTESARSFDPIWEEKYAAGHAQRYPWDSVVSFVYRHAPRDRPRSEVRILEVGCGTASNLWFAAREGFQVAGIDASESAIRTARARFSADGLTGDLRVGNFVALPFPDATFDLAIDRAALACCGYDDARRAVREIHRTVRPSGKFFFNTYGDRHTSAGSGDRLADGRVLNISAGTLTGAGQLCFYRYEQLAEVLGTGWKVLFAQELIQTDRADPTASCHAEWRVIAERI